MPRPLDNNPYELTHSAAFRPTPGFAPHHNQIEVKTKGAISMKIRPLQDRVLVKRIQEEEKTKGGIIIPDTAKEKPQEGKVIAVGKGKVNEDGKLTPLDVKAGDRILFGKYSGTEVKIEGEEHLIMREEDILGILE
jgi:chaperonin GroES